MVLEHQDKEDRLLVVLIIQKKRFLCVLMKTIQLTGAATYDSHMEMHTSTLNTDISLARGLQKHLPDPTVTHGVMHHGKDRK